MKTSCISHPASEPLVVLHAWQQQAFGDAVVGALISYFEYWHNVKLSGTSERKHLRGVAEDHGDLSMADIGMLQYHTQDEIEEGLLGIAKKTKIKSSIAILADESIVSRHNNPNDRYKFDRTIYYLFNSTLVNEFLHFRSTAKLHWSNTTDAKKKGFSYSWSQFKADKAIFGPPSVESDSPSVEYDHSSVENDSAITEITPETSTESKEPPNPQQAGGQSAEITTEITNTSLPPKGDVVDVTSNLGGKPMDVDVLIAEFNEEFWPIAYKKVSIASARKAYISARTGSKKAKRPPVDKETILAGWKIANEVLFPKEDERKKAESERFGSAYAPKQFIPMPATWLNQERWANEDVRALLDAPKADRPKSEILRSIGIELKRLGLTGALNWNWQKRTGKTLVSQLDGESAIAYLAELEAMSSADDFAC